jgi:hypothetical protein
MLPHRHITALEPDFDHSLVPLWDYRAFESSQLGEPTPFECVIHNVVDAMATFVLAAVLRLDTQTNDRT